MKKQASQGFQSTHIKLGENKVNMSPVKVVEEDSYESSSSFVVNKIDVGELTSNRTLVD